MSAATFLATFPQTQTGCSTGGGCTAWILDLPNGGQIMLTTPEDSHEPDTADVYVDCYSYDCNGDLDECAGGSYYFSVTWERAIAFAREKLGEVHGR